MREAGGCGGAKEGEGRWVRPGMRRGGEREGVSDTGAWKVAIRSLGHALIEA
jgi:hypothetical protein